MKTLKDPKVRASSRFWCCWVILCLWVHQSCSRPCWTPFSSCRRSIVGFSPGSGQEPVRGA